MAIDAFISDYVSGNKDTSRLAWFNEARFGMFIHWGLYSLLGRGEWVRFQERIPAEEYAALADQFAPRFYDPRAWARLAREAGMRYMVMTAKHHDGFCLFGSRQTDFTSVKTAARRDLVAEYVAACREEGLGVGLYFTLKDWTFPAYFRGPDADSDGWAEMVAFIHAQVRELMTQYGPIDILWYDGGDDANFQQAWAGRTEEVWRSAELNAMVRSLQSGILINDRSGLPEDFGTPEQEIPTRAGAGRMAEACLTLNNSWGYNPGDRDWKSPGRVLSQLVACAARGNNYLLNIGPDADGLVPSPAVHCLQAVGAWLRSHGEAIYGTKAILPDWWDYTSTGRITSRENQAYVIVQQWPADDTLAVGSLGNEVQRATLLATRQELTMSRNLSRLLIGGLPPAPPDALMNVIRLDLDVAPRPQFFETEMPGGF